MVGSERARELLETYRPIDLHADTLMWSRWVGYDMHRAHEPPLPFAALGGHIDIPRMRAGHMSAQFFGLVSLPLAPGAKGLGRVVHEQIDILDAYQSRWPSELMLATSVAQLEACQSKGAIAAFLGIEGAHALEGSLDNLEVFAKRGVRYLGLLHFSANEAGYPAYGRGQQRAGLTTFGFDLVEACEQHRVLVDLAHINREGFLDACRVARRPLIVSHTGVLGAFEHWRNIGDDQLRAVADRGGVVGIIFCPRYLGGEGIEPVVRHLDHIVSTVGEDHVALGSDWDGFMIPTQALKDPRGLPLLVDGLIGRGWNENAIGKLLSGNVLRVLQDAWGG